MKDTAGKLARINAPPPRPVARLAAKRAALEEFERVQAGRAPLPLPATSVPEARQGSWSWLRLSRDDKHGSPGMKWVVSRAAFGGVASACVVAFATAILWPMFVNRDLPALIPSDPVPSERLPAEQETTIDLSPGIHELPVPDQVIEQPVSSPVTSNSTPVERPVAEPVPQPAASPGPLASASAELPPAQVQGIADELVVTGSRTNQRQAMGAKREAAGYAGTITSEDIGEVQDQNVVESLKRKPDTKAPLDRSGLAKVQSSAGGVVARGDGRVNITIAPAAPPVPYEAEGDDKFQHFEINAIRQVSTDPYSTFSVDVDTASYAFSRRMINEGRLPQKDAVRVEEMINYFDYAWPKPDSRRLPFESTIAVGDSPWNKGKKLVHIGIKGYEMARGEAPDANLVLLLDVSGSMNAPDKLPLAVSSMELLLQSLKPTDTVAIVVYAGAAGQVLAPTPVKEKDTIVKALRSLTPGGSTAGAEGIELAYKLAEKSFRHGGVNRVLLATDGDFNVGIDGTEELKSFIERKRERGIFLSVLGFGQGNYRDELAQALAQNGNGVAAYIDTINEAKKVLVNEATGSLFTIAKDVKLQVEFDPDTVAEYRLVGYETRSLKREDFNNDRVDAGDVGAGHTVTALYEITPVGSSAVSVDPPRYTRNGAKAPRAEGGQRDEYGFLRIRYKLPTDDVSRLVSRPIPLQTRNLSAVVQREVKFSTAVAGFAQILKGGTYTGDLTFEDVIESAQNAKGEDRNGYRAEFVDLVRKAQKAQGK